MKYFYAILTMLSLTIFIYPEFSNVKEIQYYDMSEYEIEITPKNKE